MFRLLANMLLVFVLTSVAPAFASMKYYQYKGNLPFIEMMLNMMTVMGILDKVPTNYMNDIAFNRFNGYNPSSMGSVPMGNNAMGNGGNFGGPYNNYGPNGRWSLAHAAPVPNCESILCGNRLQLLDGLWREKNGGMLGVKNHKFLWHNGNDNYITGLLQVKNDLILAHMQGLNVPMKYQYKINDNQLMMRDQNGVVKYFKKVRLNGFRR